MKATFTGRNKSGYVEYWGYRFPCGESVEIKGEAVEGAKRHPEFEVSGHKIEDLSDPHDIPPVSEEALVEAAKPAKRAYRKRK